LTENTPEEVADLMNRYGFSEKEALAAHHLRQAHKLFDEIFASQEEEPTYAANVFNEITYGIHFITLAHKLGRAVLNRDYPAGWAHNLYNKGDA
jgi:hypothetical protein